MTLMSSADMMAPPPAGDHKATVGHSSAALRGQPLLLTTANCQTHRHSGTTLHLQVRILDNQKPPMIVAPPASTMRPAAVMLNPIETVKQETNFAANFS